MDRLKKVIKNMPLKKAFCYIFMITIVTVFCFALVTSEILHMLQNNIVASLKISYANYNDSISSLKSQEYYSIYKQFMSQGQNNSYRITLLAEYLLPFLYIFIGIAIAALLFYKWKLEEPLSIIMNGIRMIKNQDLDFQMRYPYKDEMGEVCEAFEQMRNEIQKNNLRMCKILEEREIVNKSIAHDLRSPLTVMKGYSELLIKNIPIKKMSNSQVIHVLMLLLNAVNRMEDYVKSVRLLQKMEDVDIQYSKVKVKDFLSELEENLKMLSSRYHKEFHIENRINSTLTELNFDKVIVFRVLENIVLNSCIRAEKDIYVRCTYIEKMLGFLILDDGNGFAEEDNKEKIEITSEKYSDENTGIGLIICKALCKKHQGSIQWNNTKGANVNIEFLTKDKNSD